MSLWLKYILRLIRPERHGGQVGSVYQVAFGIVAPGVAYRHRLGNLRCRNNDLVPLNLRLRPDKLLIRTATFEQSNIRRTNIEVNIFRNLFTTAKAVPGVR